MERKETIFGISPKVTLSEVLQKSHEFLQGKYFAVTAFDSGSLMLSDEERILGWTNEGDIAFSPKYGGSSEIHIPTYGFDEGYLLEEKNYRGV
ncbi:MAG: hypothetical protein EOP48_20375 [Sphingobacteriales bacterium]|nr:MAG: hypothetical protein EOP48_20375 [Sphingobacteriales bacterium]